MAKKLGELIQPREKFHEDLPQVEFRSLIDTAIEIQDLAVLREFKGPKGRRDFWLIKAANVETGEVFTTGTSAVVVSKKLEEIHEHRLQWLPVEATVVVKMGDSEYFDLE